MSKLLIFLFVLLISFSVNAMEMENYDIAVLRALDKINGKTSVLNINVGEKANFGEISIELLACQKSSPLDAPESVAFLNVKDKNSKDLFKGWMYASSPALSAMEHGVYDIWVVECLKKEDDKGI